MSLCQLRTHIEHNTSESEMVATLQQSTNKIYHTVNRLRSFLSFCHPVIGHLIIQSFVHLVIQSLGHLVTWSLGHSVTQSLGDLVTR